MSRNDENDREEESERDNNAAPTRGDNPSTPPSTLPDRDSSLNGREIGPIPSWVLEGTAEIPPQPNARRRKGKNNTDRGRRTVPNPSGTGRRPLQIDFQKVYVLAAKGHTNVGIAAILDVHPDTLTNRCSDILSAARNLRDSELQRKMFQAAEDGSERLMVWLSKNTSLNMKDKVDHTTNGESVVVKHLYGVTMDMLGKPREAPERGANGYTVPSNGNGNGKAGE